MKILPIEKKVEITMLPKPVKKVDIVLPKNKLDIMKAGGSLKSKLPVSKYC